MESGTELLGWMLQWPPGDPSLGCALLLPVIRPLVKEVIIVQHLLVLEASYSTKADLN